jgi:hypothetical protein
MQSQTLQTKENSVYILLLSALRYESVVFPIYISYSDCILVQITGVCVGWKMLTGKESLIEIQDLLYMYCPNAPKYVVYDFACRLRTVMMSRETVFACQTVFKSDIFHGPPPPLFPPRFNWLISLKFQYGKQVTAM